MRCLLVLAATLAATATLQAQPPDLLAPTDALSPADVASLAVDPSIEAYYKFNEGTGTFTADSSGNGHDGTLGTGVTWGPGRSATASVSPSKDQLS